MKDDLQRINAETSRVQNQLWAAVRDPAVAKPTIVTGLAVSGMNDVLIHRGYTQAAWWNRIPAAAWIFMVLMAICANVMIGYGARNATSEPALLIVLPTIVSIAFLLIGDIDSPGARLDSCHSSKPDRPVEELAELSLPHRNRDTGLRDRRAHVDFQRHIAGRGIGGNFDVHLEQARHRSGRGAGVLHLGGFAVDQHRHRARRCRHAPPAEIRPSMPPGWVWPSPVA